MTEKKNNKRLRLLGGLTVAVLLPLSLYLIVKALSADKIFLPNYYVVERVDEIKEDGKTIYDTVYHKAADITLVNQLGDSVSLNKDLSTKIILVNFFFTQCPTICPKLTGNMTILQRAFKKNDTTVHLVSISVDPERDSFPAIRKYADGYGVNHDHWWLLTGDRDTIYNYARNELRVVMNESGQGTDDFVHSQKLVLLDKDRHIRGYYDGLDTMELKRCADDIVLLSLEKKRKK
ncbi:MAG: SCO family protein [Chitinophagales bacterium]|nr:SCO family protein [Chitinophagaceae bacterium]MCB9064445.1 SCO family protein [Chitinophagales bacterium]